MNTPTPKPGEERPGPKPEDQPGPGPQPDPGPDEVDPADPRLTPMAKDIVDPADPRLRPLVKDGPPVQSAELLSQAEKARALESGQELIDTIAELPPGKPSTSDSLTSDEARAEIEKLPAMYRSKPDDLQWSDAERHILNRVTDLPVDFKLGSYRDPQTFNREDDRTDQATFEKAILQLLKSLESSAEKLGASVSPDPLPDPEPPRQPLPPLPFMPGDKVKLLTGGPVMTIEAVEEILPKKGLGSPRMLAGTPYCAVVSWFDKDGDFCGRKIAFAAFELVEAGRYHNAEAHKLELGK